VVLRISGFSIEIESGDEDDGDGPGSPEPYGIKLLLSARLRLGFGLFWVVLIIEVDEPIVAVCHTDGYTVVYSVTYTHPIGGVGIADNSLVVEYVPDSSARCSSLVALASATKNVEYDLLSIAAMEC
jgi:hypothetical protein